GLLCRARLTNSTSAATLTQPWPRARGPRPEERSMKRCTIVLAVLAGLPLLAGKARADAISWDYKSEGGSVGQGTDLIGPPFGGWYEVSIVGVPTTHKVGSATVTLIDKGVSTIIDPGNLDFFPVSAPSGVGITITDGASHLSGTAGFDAFIEGSAFNTAFNAAWLTSTQPQVLILGQNRYTVTPLTNT